MDQSQTFHVGLCMAGAVSAGAYTAGVMDYLIEALEDWESQRGKQGVPTHRVTIPVIGGASGGGMTGMIAAGAINNPINHIQNLDQVAGKSYTGNKFWSSWVDMLTDDMFPLLLDRSDIKEGKIYSLLNSTFIDKLADLALKIDPDQWIYRPYFEKHLKTFVTLSSLRGLSFDITFRGLAEDDRYCVTQHNDFVTFELNLSSYRGDGWIPLDFRSHESVALARDAAIATGAFPVGLRARFVSRNSQYVNDNMWLKPITSINPVRPSIYESLNVDGGLINNEPFEKVRDVLVSITGQKKPADYNHYNSFTSTVLMIDPFPSLPPVYNPNDHILAVVGSTLTTLINQVRVKPEHLVDAMDSHKAGQYLIAPSRAVPQLNGLLKDELGAKAIACGSISGFSGFLSKEFRIHDFFLGRANCEKFLRDHFTVPADSRNIITDGYAYLSDDEKLKYYSATSPDARLPIIPILSARKKDKYLPVFSNGSDWPVVTDKDIDRYRPQIKERINALLMNMTEYKPLTKILLQIGGWVLLNRKLTNVSIDFIKQSLKEHQLIKSKGSS